jgi:hypothetical protein
VCAGATVGLGREEVTVGLGSRVAVGRGEGVREGTVVAVGLAVVVKDGRTMGVGEGVLTRVGG